MSVPTLSRINSNLAESYVSERNWSKNVFGGHWQPGCWNASDLVEGGATGQINNKSFLKCFTLYVGCKFTVKLRKGSLVELVSSTFALTGLSVAVRLLCCTHLVDFVGFGESLADVQVRVPQRVVDVARHRFSPDQPSLREQEHGGAAGNWNQTKKE